MTFGPCLLSAVLNRVYLLSEAPGSACGFMVVFSWKVVTAKQQETNSYAICKPSYESVRPDGMEPGCISVRAPHTMACVGIELSVRAAAYDGVRWDTGVAVIFICL